MTKGHLHPLTQILRKIVKVFIDLGFEVIEGPEVETEYYNFDSLRIPRDHPARDVQDTFWLKDGRLLRTQTSSVQSNLFQLDGFAIDKNITMAHLKGTLKHFLKEIFGKEIKTRFVPHHYPFVEPGMDVHIFYNEKWLEVLGSGMIHPEVLKNMGVDPKKWQGFAFGLGIDRLMMLYFGINDIRLSHSGDLRFFKQF